MESIMKTIRRPDLIFRPDGHFDLSARVTRILDLHPGDAIDILSDGTELYLYIAHRSNDVNDARYLTRVYPTKNKSRHFRGASVQLCRSILALAGSATRADLPCGMPVIDTVGRTLLPIITRHNLAKL